MLSLNFLTAANRHVREEVDGAASGEAAPKRGDRAPTVFPFLRWALAQAGGPPSVHAHAVNKMIGAQAVDTVCVR